MRERALRNVAGVEPVASGTRQRDLITLGSGCRLDKGGERVNSAEPQSGPDRPRTVRYQPSQE